MAFVSMVDQLAFEVYKAGNYLQYFTVSYLSCGFHMFSTKSNIPALNKNHLLSSSAAIGPDWQGKEQQHQLQLLSENAAPDWIRDKAISDFFIKLEELPAAVLADVENNKGETCNADNQLSSDTDIDWSRYEDEIVRDPSVELENPPEAVLADVENNKGETSNTGNQLSSDAVVDRNRVEDAITNDFLVEWEDLPEDIQANVKNNKGETSNADEQSGLTAANSFNCPATGNKYDAFVQMLNNSDFLNPYKLKYDDEHVYTCDECNSTFKKKGTFERHKKYHKPLYKCTDCNLTFKFESQYSRHKASHSSERPFVCGQCSKSFKSLNNLKDHEKNHSDDRPFVCNICSMAFKHNNVLKNHRKIHNSPQYACNICEKRFARSNDVLRHQRVHKKKKTS